MRSKLALLYLSRTVGAVGFHLFSLFAILQAYELSPTLRTMGTLGLSTFVGSSLVVLFSGSLVDWVRRQGLYAFSVHAGVALLALGSLILSLKTTTLLFVLVMIVSAFRILRSPVYFVLSRMLMQKSSQPLTASRFYVISWQAAGVLGPLVGGLLSLKYGLVALQISYCLCFVIAALLLLPLVSENSVAPSERQKSAQAASSSLHSWFSGMQKSLRFFVQDRVVRDSFLIDTFGVLFAGVAAFLPFLLGAMHVSSNYIGIIRAAQNFGSLLVALTLSSHYLKEKTGKTFIVCILGFALMTASVPFVGGPVVLGLVFFTLGAFDGVSILVRDLLLLHVAPRDLQGKVYALNSVFISSSDDLGEMESGFVGHLIGIPATAILGAVLCGGLTLFLTWRSKKLWNYQLSPKNNSLMKQQGIAS